MQKVLVFQSPQEASAWLARIFDRRIKWCHQMKRKIVLGLPTGETPKAMYQQLIDLHNADNGTPWKDVVTFNLDEFVNIDANHPERFTNFMQEHLFKGIGDLPRSSIHIPDGNAADLEQECKNYEHLITENGGIDLQLITLGINGHMAYNEPGTSLNTYTQIVELTPETRENLIKQKKFASLKDTPSQAITVGVKTILDTKEVIMVSFGKSKAEMTKAMIQGSINDQVSASALQRHPNCTFVVDKEAASLLNPEGIQMQEMFI